MPGSSIAQPWWPTFEGWPIPTAVLAVDGRPVWLNDAFCTLLGRTAEEVIAQGLDVLAVPLEADREPELRARALAGEGGAYRVHRQFRSRAGRVVAGDLAVALVRSSPGSPGHFVAQFIQADHPERSTEREQLFLQSVSHELRTPLTSIVGPLELLRDRSDLPADVLRQLDTVRRNADRLARQVADLLDVARMEEGRLELEEDTLDFATLARSVVDARSQDAASADLALAYDGPRQLPVRADRDRLRQMLDHLVGNAVKFGEPGGRIVVRARADGADLRVSVEDSGVGMEPDEVGAVFLRFVRGAAARRRAARGTGIGLWVVRNIVHAHGGRVEVERTGPDGTVVGVVLPGRAVETRSSTRGPTSLWAHSPDVAWVDTGEVVTALDLSDDSRPQALEGVAAVIWRVLAEPQSVESLLDALAGDFPDTDRGVMRGDVEQFVAQLAAARLVATLED